MALKLLARTRESTATVGTGPIALGGAFPQNLAFGPQMGDGDTTFACALSSDGTAWEEGFYTMTSGALVRTQILSNHLGTLVPVALNGGRVFGIIPPDILLLLAKILSPLDQQIVKYDAGLGRFISSFGGGVSWHQAVALATAVALPANTYANGTLGVGATLTGNANGPLTVDGVAVVVGYRILVKNEATAAHNGIFVATAAGVTGVSPYILTRATDHDDASDIAQADTVAVGPAGAINGRTIWISTISTGFVVGTSNMTFGLVVGVPPVTSNGDVLTVVGGVPAWAAPTGGGSLSLDDLTDVVITSPAIKQGLRHNGTDFVNAQYALTDFSDVNYSSPAAGDTQIFDGTHWINTRPNYGISFSAPQTTAYAANQVVGHHVFSVGSTMPANFGPYNGRVSKAGGTANATASMVVSVEKASTGTPNTFSQIGTITIAATGVASTLATASGTAKTFSAGDILRLVMPGTPDATFAGFYCTIAAHET